MHKILGPHAAVKGPYASVNGSHASGKRPYASALVTGSLRYVMGVGHYSMYLVMGLVRSVIGVFCLRLPPYFVSCPDFGSGPTGILLLFSY